MPVELPLPEHRPAGSPAPVGRGSPPEGSLASRGPAASRRRWRRFAVGQALAWSGVAVLFSVAAVARGRPPAAVAWLVAANVAVGLVISTGLAAVLQRLRWQTLPVLRQIPLGLAGALLAATGHVTLATLSSQIPGGWSFTGFASPDPFGVVRPLILYLLWTTAHLAASLYLQRRDARARVAALEREARDMEFQLLRDQFDPHFLFNSLTLIQAEADDATRVRELLLRLSQYLRAALGSSETLVPLGRQAEACVAYLKLQEARFGPRLSWRIAIDDDVAEMPLPSLTVQTLVEHAVRAGLEADSGEAEIMIAARRERNEFVVDVARRSMLPSTEKSVAVGPDREPAGADSSPGLERLARRLELGLGPRAGLSVWGESGVAHVTIRIPHERNLAGDRCPAPRPARR